MIDNISCCGSDCSKCACYSSLCSGCNACQGKVFHSKEGCPIYECVINKKNLRNCGNCSLVPCDIWKKTRDPKFTDEEFEQNMQERIKILNNVNQKDKITS